MVRSLSAVARRTRSSSAAPLFASVTSCGARVRSPITHKSMGISGCPFANLQITCSAGLHIRQALYRLPFSPARRFGSGEETRDRTDHADQRPVLLNAAG